MVVVPRLDRDSALELLIRLLNPDVEALALNMPDLSPVVTYSPTGGNRISEQQLREMRSAVVNLALEYGMPEPLANFQEFEGRSARLIHQLLPMTPHEFADEEVWSYLTCCWLLDVAVWRFGVDADSRRFIGDVNRNTFRRMWWRADVLGNEIDLSQLGEDELVNITERPTVAADRRLARSVAREFLARVDRREADARSLLMREAMKRLLRLTPFVAFAALSEAALQRLIEDVFDGAASGLSGANSPAGGRHQSVPDNTVQVVVPTTNPDVVSIPRMTIYTRPDAASTSPKLQVADDFDTVAEIAVEIAQRSGRVTNEGLRAVASITADEARAVFRDLVAKGSLIQRGAKLGTHYVIPAASHTANSESAGSESTPISGNLEPKKAPPPASSARSADSALHRLLRRNR